MDRIVAFLLAICATAQFAFGQTAQCPQEKADAAEAMTDGIKSWNDVGKFYDEYRNCDEGSVAEGMSEATVRLLGDHWSRLPDLMTSAYDRLGLEGFVAGHIDQPLDTADMRKVHDLAKGSCPQSAARLCRKLSRAAVAAGG